MSNTIAAGLPARGRNPFALQYPWDRNFFLALVALMWAGVLVGFGWDVIDHVRTSKPAYPVIVHIHAVVFVAWLVLLTTQTLLVRARRLDVHRRLGLLGMALAPLLPVVGLSAEWVTERIKHGTPDADPAFLITAVTMMSAFIILIPAAYRLRGDPSAHKRLILLATLYLSAAGFARWEFFTLANVVGTAFWGFFFLMYAGADLLIVALGAYDLATRGRLHPAYVAGTLVVFAHQIFANWLYFNPAWKPVAERLLGF